jgi:alpha-L-fucosidase
MKHTLTLFAALLLVPLAAPYAADYVRVPTNDAHWKPVKAYVEETPLEKYRQAPEAAWEAFRDLKYGVRIHWGLYAAADPQTGEVSWPLLAMSPAERQRYQELYRSFNPVDFNADAWMRLFREAECKVFAFTTKHHDGFSMYDTHARVKQRVNWTAAGGPRFEDCDVAYSIMETPFKRDIVQELCESARRTGIKVDLYYSHPDWYDADFRPYVRHPAQVPTSPDLRKNTNQVLMADARTTEETARMMARHRTQLTELLSRYGKVDMLCLDMWLGADVWPQLRETIMHLRQMQPNVMLRARGIGNYGDYYTPEGFVPGAKENTAMPWMVIYPLAGGTGGRGKWGYTSDAARYQDAGWIVSNLVDTVAKGGNFMVGIGPDARGSFHPRAVAALRETGAWLRINGEGVFATRPRPGACWGEGSDIRYTQSKDHRYVFAFTLKWPGQQLSLHSVQAKPGSKITMFGTSTPLAWKDDSNGGLTISLPAKWQDATQRPCQWAWGFKIETAEPDPSK